jgi:hypothetical protein
MTLEEEMIEKAGTAMAREIDREVLWGMLEGIGWTRVMIPTLGSRQQAIDIPIWLEENCKDAFERNGRDLIFESQKDANWFVLRWGTE